jgi:nitrite reductase/ring-hydroxylating ferredoxin subunit
MAYKLAMDLASLQNKNRQTLTIEQRKILFLWHEDHVYAIQPQCPHLKLPLAKGKITKQCTIVCPFHHSEFDLKSGKAQCWSPWPPLVGKALGLLAKEKDLRVYPTKVDNDQIWVDID